MSSDTELLYLGPDGIGLNLKWRAGSCIQLTLMLSPVSNWFFEQLQAADASRMSLYDSYNQIQVRYNYEIMVA